MQKKALSIILLSFICLAAVKPATWGFFGHKLINRQAVFLLPPDLFPFFKDNVDYISEHAVDPDKRRYAVKGEAPRHFIDIDHFDTDSLSGLSIVPKGWKDAVALLTEDTLQEYGILPWHISLVTKNLEGAFRVKDKSLILKHASDLGHYIADAHVPLHTTENYNGQLTGQKGIHAFWESRLPELYANDYNFFLQKAEYIDDVLTYSWEMIRTSHMALDSVLLFDAKLDSVFSKDEKYSYEKRGKRNVKVYSKAYSEAYNTALSGMVERQMRSSIRAVANLWYTAWVNAGQPELMEVSSKNNYIDEADSLLQNEGTVAPREHE